MRKYFILTCILATTAFFISCKNKAGNQQSEEKKSEVRCKMEEVNIQRRVMPIAFDFSNICSLCGINIEYTQGDKCQIELEGDSALLNHVTIDIESSLLTLGLHSDANERLNMYETNYRLTAYITAPTLQYVSLCEGGNFYSRGTWTGSNVHIGALRSGSFFVDDLQCETFKFEGSDTDRSVFKNLKTHVATIVTMRKSRPTFTVHADQIIAIADNESLLTLNGTAKRIEKSVRGKAQLIDNLK